MERTDSPAKEVVELLKQLIEFSERQLYLMQEKRLEELLTLTERREKRFEQLKRLLTADIKEDPEVKELVKTLIDKDRRLTLNIESELTYIKERMQHLPTRLKALRTYTKIEAYNKD